MVTMSTYTLKILVDTFNLQGKFQADTHICIGSNHLCSFANSNLYAQRDSFGTSMFCRNRRDFVFQIQPRMIIDMRKDYRQTLKFYNDNVVPKENADE